MMIKIEMARLGSKFRTSERKIYTKLRLSVAAERHLPNDMCAAVDDQFRLVLFPFGTEVYAFPEDISVP